MYLSMGLSFYCSSCSFWFTRFGCDFKTGFACLLVLHIAQCCLYFIFLWHFEFLHHLVWQRIVLTFLTFLFPNDATTTTESVIAASAVTAAQGKLFILQKHTKQLLFILLTIVHCPLPHLNSFNNERKQKWG